MNKLAYSILYVTDVEAALNFYKVSFGFAIKFLTPEKDYGELLTGETSLAFASHALALSNLKDGFIVSDLQHKPFGIELGIVCDDVQATLDLSIQHGATLIESPKKKPWGQTVAYVRDLDGFLLELCTTMN